MVLNTSWLAGARLAKTSVHGGVVVSHIRGAGPTVVMLHPLMFDSRVWSPQIERLKSSYTTVAVDQRGHGLSPPATVPYDPAVDVDVILSGLGIRRSVIIGMGDGAEYALRVAVRAKTEVMGLLLVLPTVAWLVRELDPQRLYAEAEKAAARLAADEEFEEMRCAIASRDEEAIAACITAISGQDIPEGHSARALLAAMARTNANTVFQDDLLIPAPTDLATRLRTVTVRSVVLAASCESADELRQSLSRHLVDLDVAVIQSNSPAVTLARPDACSDAIMRFLAEVLPPEG